MSAVAAGNASWVVLAQKAAARLMHRCGILAECTDRPGEILRTFLSPAMHSVHEQIRPWLEAAGMIVRVDGAGNLRGLYPAENGSSASRLILGSHLDTVPNAGAYDGVVGVLLGLALVEAGCGRKYPYAIEIIGFSDEEGTRFGAPFLGSRALVNELSSELLEYVDASGISVKAAMRQFALERPGALAAELAPESAAYLEFHIEQGPVLESKNLALGVVEALAGQSRSTVIFQGRAGHAGTTPMKLRHDALAAAAEWITQIEAHAARDEGLVATVGRISVEPGAVNVIPGRARLSLDVRHANDAVRDAAVKTMVAQAYTAGARRGVSVEVNEYHKQAAVYFNQTMLELADRAMFKAGYDGIRMTSGAGHDALVIAPHLPATMVFLRSPGGISHHPDETVLESDVAAAIHMGLHFLEEFSLLPPKKEAHALA